jgi:hypothetical protein
VTTSRRSEGDPKGGGLSPGTPEDDRLDLRSARVEVRDGYPTLILDLAGRTARLDTEWHPALRKLGLVWIGNACADMVPVRTYTDPESGGTTELVGHTDDPRIYELFGRFWEGRLAPGPVTLPR